MDCKVCPLKKTKYCSDIGCGIAIIDAALKLRVEKLTASNKPIATCDNRDCIFWDLGTCGVDARVCSKHL